jgi:hypothetical protein
MARAKKAEQADGKPPVTTITMWGFYCLRCGHRWVPRGLKQPEREDPPRKPMNPGPKPDEYPEEVPRVCPLCKSPYWDRERRQ